LSNFAKQGKSEKNFVYQFIPKKVKIGENIFLMKNYTIDKTSFTILSFLAKRLHATSKNDSSLKLKKITKFFISPQNTMTLATFTLTDFPKRLFDY
jgi:hypothetical protein